MIKSKEISEELKKSAGLDRKRPSILKEKIALIQKDQEFQKVIASLEITDDEYRQSFGFILDAYNSFINQDSSEKITLYRGNDGSLYIKNEPKIFSLKQSNYLFHDFDSRLLDLDVNAIDDKNRGGRLQLTRAFFEYRNSNNTNWLYLYGGVGVGKTYAVVLNLNSYLNVKKDARIGVLDTPNFMSTLVNYSFDKETQNDYFNILETAKNLDVLVLDDFAGGATSPYARDLILLPILEHRAKRNLLTIFISRFPLSDAVEIYKGSKKEHYLKNQILQELMNSKLKQDYIIDFGRISRF